MGYYINPIYRFTLSAEVGETTKQRVSNPVYGEITKDYEKESGEEFFRKNLNGKLTFMDEDYDFIDTKPFDTVFGLLVEISYNNGGTWLEYQNCYFTKTDCEWDVDNKVISVSPKSNDEYTKILSGIDKEFNLIELAPEICPIKMTKRSAIQVYSQGDSSYGVFIGSTYWENGANDPTASADDLIDAHFGYVDSPSRITISLSITGDFNILDPKINTTYNSVSNNNKNGRAYYGYYYSENNEYYIRSINAQFGRDYYYVIQIRQTSDDSIVCFARIYCGRTLEDWTIGKSESLIVYLGSDYLGDVSQFPSQANALSIKTAFMYVRLLVADESANPITDTDPVGSSGNLSFCYPILNWDKIVFGFEDQETPTEWGLNNDGGYWAKPDIGETIVPIAKGSWDFCSVWSKLYSSTQFEEDFTLKDAFPLSSCINVLLKEIDPEVTHEASPEFSEFLYGDNSLKQDPWTLFITPKTNILVSGYDQPASQAKVTLRQILNMLKNTLQCYWYVEDGKLKIEHIKFFRNGGSYSEPLDGKDLTELETRFGKKMSFGTGKFMFEKDRMPERYEFSWADKGTTVFEGLPIQVVSNYAEPGNIERVNVPNFSSDVDLGLVSPENFSNEGFFLLAPTGNKQDGYTLPIIQVIVDGQEYILQNGYMAFCSLQPKYWTWNLSAKTVIINGQTTIADGVSKSKVQKVEFTSLEDPDTKMTIKTGLGHGQIRKLSVNLASRNNEIELVYDSE